MFDFVISIWIELTQHYRTALYIIEPYIQVLIYYGSMDPFSLRHIITEYYYGLAWPDHAHLILATDLFLFRIIICN